MDNDTISRQAAIDAADRADYTGLAVEDVEKVTDEVVKELKRLPSAQPERKRGKWILKPNIYGVAYCSECDFELHINNTNFCPNCGAKMEVEHEA